MDQVADDAGSRLHRNPKRKYDGKEHTSSRKRVRVDGTDGGASRSQPDDEALENPSRRDDENTENSSESSNQVPGTTTLQTTIISWLRKTINLPQTASKDGPQPDVREQSDQGTSRPPRAVVASGGHNRPNPPNAEGGSLSGSTDIGQNCADTSSAIDKQVNRGRSASNTIDPSAQNASLVYASVESHNASTSTGNLRPLPLVGNVDEQVFYSCYVILVQRC